MNENATKKVGRPPINAEPMTAAERKRKQLAKRKESGLVTYSIVIPTKTAEIIDRYCSITGVSKLTQISTITEIALYEWTRDVETRFPEIEAMIKSLNKDNKLKPLKSNK
jgi:hypothetical protein